MLASLDDASDHLQRDWGGWRDRHSRIGHPAKPTCPVRLRPPGSLAFFGAKALFRYKAMDGCSGSSFVALKGWGRRFGSWPSRAAIPVRRT